MADLATETGPCEPRRSLPAEFRRVTKFFQFLGGIVAWFVIHANIEAAAFDQRLFNLSTLAQVGTGGNVLISGFNIQDGAPKKILIRAVGPRLASPPFGLSGVLTDPQLQIFNADGTLILANDNWAADDGATMVTVGAFPLNPGSRDAALVATLSAGTYTVHVSGINNGTGLAILEIYDASGSARLMNLSTRAFVGGLTPTLISGLVVAPGPKPRRVLIRAAGPSLRDFGVENFLPDPAIAMFDGSGRPVAGAANDNWGSRDADTLTAAFAQAGAFPFAPGSKDAAILVDVTAGNYTIQVSDAGGGSGIALVEVYDLSPDAIPTVSVAASISAVEIAGGGVAEFVINRVGPVSDPVTVNYSVTGTAVAGTDYTKLPGSVTIPAGASSAIVKLQPLANPLNLNNRTATLTLLPGKEYGVGAVDTANVTLLAPAGALFVSNLRGDPAMGVTTAYGTATVQLAANEQYALVNVSFANLSAPEVSAHLVVDGNYVLNLPAGRVSNAYWELAPVGTFTSAMLKAALKEGRVSVVIATAALPEGELLGRLVRVAGTAAFNRPPDPPALDLSAVSANDAARFLSQATFGPTTVEVDKLINVGYDGWLAEQMSLPPTLHRTEAWADLGQFGNGGESKPTPYAPNRQAAWWKIVTTGSDQLRQRVAFALSEIFVISDANAQVAANVDGMTNYYDILVQGAFGNFRALLEQVTLNPMMGIYLSMLRNAKASNGLSADENYAREIMQLFTVGLNELNPDGSLKLNNDGQPIPTYSQEIITEMAKVFTGWSYNNATPNAATNSSLFSLATPDYLNPMMLWPALHDNTEKRIIGNKLIPPGQGGVGDLKDTLDALFYHPNVGPFIARFLIQRLVTDNPSPAYIYRVAQVFGNNGVGVRGDLGAVVRAILLDYEARSANVARQPTFGKLREPLLRMTALFRAFDASSSSGRFAFSNPEADLMQAALRAPTVFGFFSGDYVPAGPAAMSGVVGPEFQILTATTALTQTNSYYSYIYHNKLATNQTIALNFDPLLPLAANGGQLMERLNLLLASGAMSKATTDKIVAVIGSIDPKNPLDRVRAAVYLTVTAPETAVQK